MLQFSSTARLRIAETGRPAMLIRIHIRLKTIHKIQLSLKRPFKIFFCCTHETLIEQKEGAAICTKEKRFSKERSAISTLREKTSFFQDLREETKKRKKFSD